MSRLLLVAAVLIGVLLGGLLQGLLDPDPPPRYREVQVPVEVLVKGEPDTIVKWRERIITRTVAAEQIATAPEAAIPDVTAFCASAGWYRERRELAANPVADTLPTEPAPPSLLFLRSISYDRGDLTLIGPQSDGDLWRGDYQVGDRFTGRVMGDSVLVQTPRFGWVRTWGERALWVAGGVAGAYVVETVR